MSSRRELWEALVVERDRAVRVARSRGAKPDEVDDVVQEATVRVAAMDDVDLVRVGPLLTVVVANLVTDRHRARARSERLERRLTGQVLAYVPPDEAVCDEGEARWLRRVASELLSEQDRRVLEMRAQGLSLGASAEALGVTYKAAERALARARTHMKRAWSATAALAGFLLGRPMTKGQSAAPAAVALAAAVLATAIGGAAWPRSAAPAERPLQTARIAPTAAVEVSPPDAPAPRTIPPQAPAPPQQPPPQPRTAGGAASGSTLAGTGKIGLGGLEAEQRVERRREDETMLETVHRCLREGLVVSESYIGCPS